MSDKCADCNCNDPSKCDKPKQGSSYTVDIVETVKSYTATFVMEDSFGENDGKCKCGTNCSCTNCTCGA
ncbi:hypothetical protein SLA2020_014290 [Shorea laevis]